MREWRLAGVRLGAASSGASGGAFIGARGRMAAWARAAGEGAPRVPNLGAQLPPVAGEARLGTSSARGKKMPPRGGFLRGITRFCGPAEDLLGACGPTWPGGLCAGQLACRRWDRAEGGERREKVMGLKRKKQKLQGPG
jgi:hypothetical protein